MKILLRASAIAVISALLFITNVDSTCTAYGLAADPNQIGSNPPNPDQKCPEGVEVYREQSKEDQTTTLMCCPPGSDVTYWNNNADACRTTKCVSSATASNSKDICSIGLDQRLFVNGSEINFIETVRDTCINADGVSGAAGYAAVCCRAKSMDDYFTTLAAAEPKEFPHFARVGKYGCGGSIYNEQWVITAAHCVVNEEEKRVQTLELDGKTSYDNCCSTVRLNIIVRDIETENSYDVEKIIVYPNSSYTSKDATYGSNSWGDVALVKLKNKITFKDNVKALRIAEPGFDATKYGDVALLTGFGMTDTDRQSMKMQKVNLKIRSKKDVNYMLNEHNQLMFAGGIMNDIVSSTVGKGDSGGPLICRDSNGNAVLCGVVSFITSFEGCISALDSDTCLANAFNDVLYFNDWITETAGTQENAELMDQPLFGKAVADKEFPAHVHITTKGGDPCGGTVLDDDVVLTAASCVQNEDGSHKTGINVVTGMMDSSTGGGKTIGVKAVIFMEALTRVARGAWDVESGRKKRMASLPLESWLAGKANNWKIQKDPYYQNNVALIKLKGKSGLKVAKRSKKQVKTGDMADEVAYPTKSWGTDANGKMPLSKRQFKLLTTQDCQSRMDRLSPLGYNAKINDNEFCGVEKYSGGSLCDRELGGGLYCKDSSGNKVLCGVQVFRLCEFNIPNEFIDVTKIKSSLDDALKQLKSV